MRYLWVEDFNDEGNSDTEKELKEQLEEAFDLKDDKVIIKKTLSSAIDFLENKENFHEFDAVLIDIRFPEGDETEIYSKYFSDIVTREFYDGNIADASGIMLYLLLVFRYHISQNKMAFVSANISNDNENLKTVDEMISIILKSEKQNLSEEDKQNYLTLEQRLGKNILKMRTKQEKKWETFIIKEKEGLQVEKIDSDKLIKDLKSIRRTLPSDKQTDKSEKSRAQVQYNTVKRQFDEIGFVMPSAFEKPKIGEKKKRDIYLYNGKRNCMKIHTMRLEAMSRRYATY